MPQLMGRSTEARSSRLAQQALGNLDTSRGKRGMRQTLQTRIMMLRFEGPRKGKQARENVHDTESYGCSVSPAASPPQPTCRRDCCPQPPRSRSPVGCGGGQTTTNIARFHRLGVGARGVKAAVSCERMTRCFLNVQRQSTPRTCVNQHGTGEKIPEPVCDCCTSQNVRFRFVI